MEILWLFSFNDLLMYAIVKTFSKALTDGINFSFYNKNKSSFLFIALNIFTSSLFVYFHAS